MKKMNMSKDMMNELVGTVLVALFGLCALIGWFKDVLLLGISRIDWLGVVVGVLAVLVALAAIVGMLAAIAGAVLDLVFKMKGKIAPLYTYIQGGGTLLAFLASVVGCTVVNLVTNLINGYQWTTTWFSAGSLIWVILVLSAVKVSYMFIFKEEKKEETIDDLEPLE